MLRCGGNVIESRFGKVAEAEHQRISALALFKTNTQIGKVLVSFTPLSRLNVQAP
jgi:hypothetical protein